MTGDQTGEKSKEDERDLSETIDQYLDASEQLQRELGHSFEKQQEQFAAQNLREVANQTLEVQRALFDILYDQYE